MQYALVIIDGASGEPFPAFGGLTSLEASATPTFDCLARTGTVGLMQNVPTQLECSSDVACLSLVGYDPATYRIGRGALEAASLGIELAPDEVALRLNLCSVEDGVMRSYSSGNIATEDSHALARELKEALDDERFTLHLGVSFRHILVARGYPGLTDLSFEVPHDYSEQNILQKYRPQFVGGFPLLAEVAADAIDLITAGKQTAALGVVAQVVAADAIAPITAEAQAAAEALIDYMDKARGILEASAVNRNRIARGELPANFAWAFWPGRKPASMRSFQEIYGKTAALNSAVDLLNGIAKLTGMEIYRFDGVTGGPDNDFAAQGRGAIRMLEEGNDLVIIHIEAPDTAGHDGSSEEKRFAIESSDCEIAARLLAYAQEHPLRIAVMPDHPTPLSTRRHSRKPVPFVVAGPGIEHNGQSRLTEVEGAAAKLMVDPGFAFIGDVLFR